MKDNLARKIYAEKIAKEIADHYASEQKLVADGHKENQENIVFAISGKWGEGKTALLRLLHEPLIREGFKVIWFNPWQYSQEDISLKRAFLCALKKELDSLIDLEDLYFDRTKTVLALNWISIFKVLGVFLVFLYLIIPAFLRMGLEEWLTLLSSTVNSFLAYPLVLPAITALLIPTVLQMLTLSKSSAKVTTAEEFENKFKELIGSNKKIVIFIDDLDRCNPKTVKTILDSLRTFFQHPECSYIITGDHTVVERFAGDELELPPETSQAQKLKEGRRFLKKLFDVYWRMPLPTPYQFGVFVDEEIASSKLQLNQKQITNLKSFLVDDYLFERNPRHIKRFLTKLRFAIEGVLLQKAELDALEEKDANSTTAIAVLDDILQNPDLLAKVLLLEEFFYPVYEQLILYPESIVYHEKSLRRGEDPTTLVVHDKALLKLLDDKQDDVEKYIALVKRAPQFTDDANSTIHEAPNFFSFSGSTGLPSTIGPDESNFDQYLKTGEVVDKLGGVLSVARKDKKAAFVQKAIAALDPSTTPVDNERVMVLKEAIRLSAQLDEWTAKITTWKSRLFEFPQSTQTSLAPDFWKVILSKKPDLIAQVKSEQPVFFESLWDFVGVESKSLVEDAKKEIEKILMAQIGESPLNLRGLEVYMQHFTSKDLENKIKDQISSPDKGKEFLEHVAALGFPKGKIASVAEAKLKSLLKSFTNIDWAVANKDYLKTISLFGEVKSNMSEWSKDVDNLVGLAGRKDALELSDDERIALKKSTLALIPKSAEFSFLENGNVLSLLDVEDKKVVFGKLAEIFTNEDELADKRAKAAELLNKPHQIWDGVEQQDVYDRLTSLNKFKKGNQAIKASKKQILESWGITDSKPKEEKEGPDSQPG